MNYKVVSKAGVDMGRYNGNSPEEALDNLARDAGYLDAEDAEKVAGPWHGTTVAESEYEDEEYDEDWTVGGVDDCALY